MPPMQPVLEDERLLLRPLAAADFAPLFAVARDPEIWALHPAHDRWREPVFRAFFDEGLASNGALAVIDRASGTIIGSSRYDIRVCRPGEVEVGWTFLARAHWGGGVNRRLKRLMLAHAFEAGFDTVIFLVGDGNLRSCRALEKVGAVLTDRRQRWEMAGVMVDHRIYAIGAADFLAGPLMAGASPAD
ncbi:GNAT family N-acetyltransferase [Sandaracinobacteroides saxicola]|uniref:GNAT family N-acetyltransferase n=2 Tax=Sandaracinobacteroides saxicola TaxID=2759707 RepID=A0A7G5IMG1_9SPHN|nr:GNAT family N-acetyltransferase [Sandaracinobacteroides saxicola]